MLKSVSFLFFTKLGELFIISPSSLCFWPILIKRCMFYLLMFPHWLWNLCSFFSVLFCLFSREESFYGSTSQFTGPFSCHFPSVINSSQSQFNTLSSLVLELSLYSLLYFPFVY